MIHWQESAEIFSRLAEIAAAGGRAALATVVRIVGSAYRRPGAKLLVEDGGSSLGGVSGGCLEADVREVAAQVLSAGTPRPRETRPAGAAVGGVLLAAGLSSRMGRNKLLLEVDGEPLLAGAARRARAAGLSPVVVVLGHQADAARQALAGVDGCRVVVNPDYARGIVTSLCAGLDALPADTAAAVVLLADMPFVTAGMIAALVARYRASTAPLVISDYEGVSAPPMLYDRSLFAELRAMDDGRCGKQVVRRHRDEAEVLSWPATALADLDTPEDVARLVGAAPAAPPAEGA
jgi:molybdenum cofactor cytidylyltransferase